MTLAIVFGSIALYMVPWVYFARRFAYNFWQNTSYQIKRAPDGEQIFWAGVVAMIWPLCFWYAAADGGDGARSWSLAPKAVRRAEQAERDKERIAALERELSIATERGIA